MQYGVDIQYTCILTHPHCTYTLILSKELLANTKLNINFAYNMQKDIYGCIHTALHAVINQFHDLKQNLALALANNVILYYITIP